MSEAVDMEFFVDLLERGLGGVLMLELVVGMFVAARRDVVKCRILVVIFIGN